MTQNAKFNTPINTTEFVDCEKIHNTGPNPTNRIDEIVKGAINNPTASLKFISAPLNDRNM